MEAVWRRAQFIFRREMDSLWNRFVGELLLARRSTGEWWPTVDVSETKDNFMIKAELPGMDEKDVNVSISGSAHYQG
jgi:HSP20 family protein